MVVNRLIAERGTGFEVEDDELDELDDPLPPWLLPWLLDDDWLELIAVEGVEDARLMLPVAEEDDVVLLVEEV